MLYSLFISHSKTRNGLFRQIEADDVALAVFICSDWQRPTWPFPASGARRTSTGTEHGTR